MKDLSNYTYSDLYDMLTHIDPYKYADRVDAVKKELDSRKESGEVPDWVVPKFNVSFSDFLDLGLVLYSLQQMASGVGLFIFSLVLISKIASELIVVDVILSLLIVVLSIGLAIGGFKMIKRMLIGVSISFFSEILLIPVLFLATSQTILRAFELEPTDVSPISFVPFFSLLVLVGLFFLIRKSTERSAKDVFSDLINFRFGIPF